MRSAVRKPTTPQSGKPLPSINTYLGLWDTGATGTVIRKKIADDLGLKPSGKVDVLAVGEGDDVHETKDVNTYLVNLYLPNSVVIVGLPVVEGGAPGCDVLIGMDVVTMGDLAITHVDGQTCMSFIYPSAQTIDFVKQINAYKNSLTPDGKRKERNRKKRQRHGRT